MKLLDFLNYIQPELLVPFLARFWGVGRVRSDLVIFSILNIYAHHFNSFGALQGDFILEESLSLRKCDFWFLRQNLEKLRHNFTLLWTIWES